MFNSYFCSAFGKERDIHPIWCCGWSTASTIWNKGGCEAASAKIKHFSHHLAWLSLLLKGPS